MPNRLRYHQRKTLQREMSSVGPEGRHTSTSFPILPPSAQALLGAGFRGYRNNTLKSKGRPQAAALDSIPPHPLPTRHELWLSRFLKLIPTLAECQHLLLAMLLSRTQVVVGWNRSDSAVRSLSEGVVHQVSVDGGGTPYRLAHLREGRFRDLLLPDEQEVVGDCGQQSDDYQGRRYRQLNCRKDRAENVSGRDGERGGDDGDHRHQAQEVAEARGLRHGCSPPGAAGGGMELRTELVPRHHAILFKSVHVSTGNIADISLCVRRIQSHV